MWLRGYSRLKKVGLRLGLGFGLPKRLSGSAVKVRFKRLDLRFLEIAESQVKSFETHFKVGFFEVVTHLLSRGVVFALDSPHATCSHFSAKNRISTERA
eukprot:sb/3478798/